MPSHVVRVRELLSRPLKSGSEAGATAVEYALMVAAIAVVIAAIVIAVGGQADAIFTDISTRFP